MVTRRSSHTLGAQPQPKVQQPECTQVGVTLVNHSTRLTDSFQVDQQGLAVADHEEPNTKQSASSGSPGVQQGYLGNLKFEAPKQVGYIS